MVDFKLKVTLIVLSAIIFSFIFIFLAFLVPLDKKDAGRVAPKTKLEHISDSLKE